jgi:hypothetical protein
MPQDTLRAEGGYPEGTVTIRRKSNVMARTNNPGWAMFQMIVPHGSKGA